MKEQRTAFDHRPDPIVGAALRTLLTATDDQGFTARVVAAAARAPLRTPLDVLAEWAHRGIAVAMLAALALGFALGRRLTVPRETLDDAMATTLSPTPGTAALANSEGPPDGSVAFATFIEP
jgi:hypothetical protein